MLKIFFGKSLTFRSRETGKPPRVVKKLTLEQGLERDINVGRIGHVFSRASRLGVSIDPGMDVLNGKLHIEEITPEGEVKLGYSERYRKNVSESKRLTDIAREILDKNPHQAASLLEKAVKLRPKNTGAHYYLGVAHSLLGEYEKAKAAYYRIFEIEPNLDHAPLWSSLGVALCKLGEYEEAKTACRRALDIDQKDAVDWYWFNLGVALLGLGEYEEAKTACRRALDINEKYETAWVNLGVALCKLGEYEEAKIACRRALDINGKNAAAWSNLGAAHGKLGEYDAAIDAFNKAIEYGPEGSSGKFVGDEFIEKGSLDKLCSSIRADFPDFKGKTIEDLNKFMREAKPANLTGKINEKAQNEPGRLSPKEHDFVVGMGKLESTSDSNKRRLLEVLYPQECPKSRPEYINTYLCLAQVYDNLGGEENYKKARDVLIKLVKFWPDAAAYYNLGEIHLKLGEYKEARDAHREVAEKEPPDGYNFLRVGLLSLSINDIGEAVVYLEKGSSIFIRDKEKNEAKKCKALVNWARAKGAWDKNDFFPAQRDLRTAQKLFGEIGDKNSAAAVKASIDFIPVELELMEAMQHEYTIRIHNHVMRALGKARKIVLKVEYSGDQLLKEKVHCLEIVAKILSQAQRMLEGTLEGDKINLNEIDALLAAAEEKFKAENFEVGLEAVQRYKALRDNIAGLKTETEIPFRERAINALEWIRILFGLSFALSTGEISARIGVSIGAGLITLVRKAQEERERRVIKFIEDFKDENTTLRELSDLRYTTALSRVSSNRTVGDKNPQIKTQIKAREYLMKIQKQK